MIGASWAQGTPLAPVEPVHFTTKDGWTLSAAYRPPSKNGSVVILIHGVGSAKAEWAAFADELGALGLGTLALDLRGHGESLAGPQGRMDFSSFDASGEWPRAQRDIEAAVNFLNRKKISLPRIGLMGASIGANLASRAAAGRKISWVALLSPGLDYRGVLLTAVGLKDKKVLLASSAQDVYAAQAVKIAAFQLEKASVLEAAGGHGVQMFEDGKFRAALLGWISRASKP